MPWTAQTFKSRHNKRLGKKNSAKAAAIANALLAKGMDEGAAIAIANKNVKRK